MIGNRSGTRHLNLITPEDDRPARAVRAVDGDKAVNPWLLRAALAVLLFGVLFGMLLAVGSSLLLAIHRFAQPLVTELGQLPGTRDYQDATRHAEAIRHPGILIVRVEEPLFFANAEQVFQLIRNWAAGSRPDTVVLSLEVCDDLDATASEKLPQGYRYDYMGEARQFVTEGSALYATFALALAIIFLVLAIQ